MIVIGSRRDVEFNFGTATLELKCNSCGENAVHEVTYTRESVHYFRCSACRAVNAYLLEEPEEPGKSRRFIKLNAVLAECGLEFLLQGFFRLSQLVKLKFQGGVFFLELVLEYHHLFGLDLHRLLQVRVLLKFLPQLHKRLFLFAPFAPRTNNELWLVAKRGIASLAQASEDERKGLSAMLCASIRVVFEIFANDDIFVIVHQLPERYDYYRLHVELFPVKPWSGAERGFGELVLEFAPEDTASALRERMTDVFNQ